MACISAASNVWARKLKGGKVAIVFIHVGKESSDVKCDEACVAKTGLAGKKVAVRDLWEHKDLGSQTLTTLTAKALPAEGGVQMLVLTPQ